jgi:hypothetical protein
MFRSAGHLIEHVKQFALFSMGAVVNGEFHPAFQGYKYGFKLF